MTTIKLDPSMIQATGAPNSSNYLRGDGTWGALIMPPVWSTQAGNIAIANEQAVFSATVLAVDVNNLTLSYTVTSGSLPTGLTSNSSTGVISGTTPMVTANTTTTFTISASNGTNSTPRIFSITINNSINEPPTWTTAAGSLGTINMNSGFNYSLSATDTNLDTLSYSVTSGSLPTGLTMNSAGTITGTTSTIGITTTSSFTVSVNDGHGGIITRNFSITVNGPANKYVMVGSAPSGALSTIYISSDAVNWATVTNTPFSGQQIWDIAKSTDTGLYAACCHGGFVGVSTDCITWAIPASQPLSPATANAEYWYSSIAYGNGVFITIGGWHGIYGLRSTDNGVTWSDITSHLGPIGGVNGKTIKFGNGVFVAHGYGGPICWSTDGLVWTSSGQSAAGYGDINFSAGLGKFIYGGESATGGGSLNYYVSSDGKIWTTGTSIGSYDSAASATKLFLLGPGGMSYSTDGTTWINKSSTWPAVGNAGNLNNPAFMASETVWITGSSTSPNVYKSTDNGNTWAIVSGVTFGAGSSQSDYVAMARYI